MELTRQIHVQQTPLDRLQDSAHSLTRDDGPGWQVDALCDNLAI
jgi:hypothetical protein